MRQVEKAVLLQTLDHLWREHLVTLDHLRQVIGFRGYAQRDPLNEYKTEAFELFQAMLGRLREAVTVAADAGRDRPAPAAAAACPRTTSRRSRRRHIDPLTGENEMAATPDAAAAFQLAAERPPDGERRDRPQRSLHLGQGAAERALPLRFGQEVQALPRPLRLSHR